LSVEAVRVDFFARPQNGRVKASSVPSTLRRVGSNFRFVSDLELKPAIIYQHTHQLRTRLYSIFTFTSRPAKDETIQLGAQQL
jgi:hypothetical protein